MGYTGVLAEKRKERYFKIICFSSKVVSEFSFYKTDAVAARCFNYDRAAPGSSLLTLISIRKQERFSQIYQKLGMSIMCQRRQEQSFKPSSTKKSRLS